MRRQQLGAARSAVTSCPQRPSTADNDSIWNRAICAIEAGDQSERERARERRRERESVRLPITPTNDGTHNRSKSCRILSIYAIVSHHAAFYANTCIEAMRQALVRRCGRVQENACCFSRYLFSKKTLLPLISSTNTTMYLIWLIWI